MFQINLSAILAAQIGSPTYLPLLSRPKHEVQASLQKQIDDAVSLMEMSASPEAAQVVDQWFTACTEAVATHFEPDEFLNHYLDRPTLGPIDISVEPGTPDHRAFVSQISQRLQALFVLTIFLPERDIVLAPQSHIHPSLQVSVWNDYVNGHFEAAVAQAWVEVEKAVRVKAEAHNGGPLTAVGNILMTHAFRVLQGGGAAPGTPGPLTDTTLSTGEQAGMRDVFGSVMQAFRNPPNHRRVTLSRQDAFGEIMFASRLIRYVDSRP